MCGVSGVTEDDEGCADAVQVCLWAETRMMETLSEVMARAVHGDAPGASAGAGREPQVERDGDATEVAA